MTDTPEEIEVETSPLLGASFRNPLFVTADQSKIDMEVDHPEHGWIPITIVEDEYPDLWQAVVASGPAPYVAPPTPTDEELRTAWRATASISRSAFCTALKDRDILTLQEAIAAAKGDWPASFESVLGALPADLDPNDMLILWAAAQRVERMHPLFEALRQYHGMTPEEADEMFGYVEPALD